MKAKIIAISLLTRVVVEDNASEDEIIEAAKHSFIDNINTCLGDNIEYIEDDIECPYDEDLDFKLQS